MQRTTNQNRTNEPEVKTHSATPYKTSFDSLPDNAIVRKWDILGCDKRKISPVWHVGNTTLNNRIKDGSFPKPIKLGGENTRCVGWRVGDVREFLANLGKTKVSI